jgi:hypothetical protein
MVAQVTPVLTVDAPEDGDALHPGLVVFPGSTHPTAAVAYVWEPAGFVAQTSARVASFDGWGAWPPPAITYADVQGTETAEHASDVALLATSDPSRGPPGFDLAYAPPDHPGNFGGAVTIFNAGVDGSTPMLQAGGATVFLATGAASGLAWPGAVNVLAGDVRPSLESALPWFTLVATPGPNFGAAFYFVGCSTTPLAADAVASGAGWLVAAGLGSELGAKAGSEPTCAKDPSAAVGPGTNLMLATLDPSPWNDQWLTQSASVLQAASPISRIRMVNRPAGGTWIVWSLDGKPDLTVGVVSSALTLGTTFPLAAVEGTLDLTSFAIESFGAELVVAGVTRMAGSNDHIPVIALDESSVSPWGMTVPTEGTVDGAVSLRASPDGSSLLLAWSELPPGGTTHRLRVARIDCSTCAADGAACAAASDCCGARCDQGTCATAVTLVGQVCTGDAVCAAGGEGAICDPTLGICVGGALCKSDADCTWATDVCNTAVSMCMSGGDACTKDADCPSGERCDPSKGGVCLPGTCAAKGSGCASDHECCSLACDTAKGSCK